MTVWKSNDLITWSNETHIDAKNIPGVSFENNLWAPQALWDDAEQNIWFTIQLMSVVVKQLYILILLTF